jgi:hypothetical protein
MDMPTATPHQRDVTQVRVAFVPNPVQAPVSAPVHPLPSVGPIPAAPPLGSGGGTGRYRDVAARMLERMRHGLLSWEGASAVFTQALSSTFGGMPSIGVIHSIDDIARHHGKRIAATRTWDRDRKEQLASAVGAALERRDGGADWKAVLSEVDVALTALERGASKRPGGTTRIRPPVVKEATTTATAEAPVKKVDNSTTATLPRREPIRTQALDAKGDIARIDAATRDEAVRVVPRRTGPTPEQIAARTARRDEAAARAAVTKVPGWKAREIDLADLGRRLTDIPAGPEANSANEVFARLSRNVSEGATLAQAIASAEAGGRSEVTAGARLLTLSQARTELAKLTVRSDSGLSALRREVSVLEQRATQVPTSRPDNPFETPSRLPGPLDLPAGSLPLSTTLPGGENVQEIARQAGVSANDVADVMRRYGISAEDAAKLLKGRALTARSSGTASAPAGGSPPTPPGAATAAGSATPNDGRDLSSLSRSEIDAIPVEVLGRRLAATLPAEIVRLRRENPDRLEHILGRLYGAFDEAMRPRPGVSDNAAARAVSGLIATENALRHADAGTSLPQPAPVQAPTPDPTLPLTPVVKVPASAQRSSPLDRITATAADPITGAPLDIDRRGRIAPRNAATTPPNVTATHPAPSPLPDAPDAPGHIAQGSGFTAPVYQGVPKPLFARGSEISPAAAPYFEVIAADGVAPGETKLRDAETRFIAWVSSNIPFVGSAQSHSIGLSDLSLTQLRKAYGVTSNAEAVKRFLRDLVTPDGPGVERSAASGRVREAVDLATSFSTRNLEGLRNLAPFGPALRTDELFEFKPEDLTKGQTFIVQRGKDGHVARAQLNTTRTTVAQALAADPSAFDITTDGRVTDYFGNNLARLKFAAGQRERFDAWRAEENRAPTWVAPDGEVRLEGRSGPEAILGRLSGGDRKMNILNDHWNISTGVTSVGMQFGVRLPGMGDLMTFAIRGTKGTGATGASEVSFQVPKGAALATEVADRVDAQLGAFSRRTNAIVGRRIEEAKRFQIVFSPLVGRAADVTSRPMLNAVIRGLDSVLPGTRGKLETALGWPGGLVPPSGYPLDWADPTKLADNLRWLGNARKTPVDAILSPYVSKVIEAPMVTPRRDAAGELVRDASGAPIYDEAPLSSGGAPPSKRLVEISIVNGVPLTPGLLPPFAVGPNGAALGKLPKGTPGVQSGIVSIGNSSVQSGVSLVLGFNPEKASGSLRMRLPSGGDVTIPTPARIILLDNEGKAVDNAAFVNRGNEDRSFGFTALFRGPGSTPVLMPAQAAFALNSDVLTWGPHSASQVSSIVERLSGSPDPEVAATAARARETFQAAPVRRGARITDEQREALRAIVRLGAERVNAP